MAHFSRATFRFLRDLADHNDTQWFRSQRDQYNRHVRDPAQSVAQAWLATLPPHYVATRPVSPPNRDIRFARDKRPYRTWVAIRVRHRLALPGAPGPQFLLWVDPAGSFLSAGVRNVSGEVRRRIAASILDDPRAWAEAREGLALSDEDLFATAPAGPDGLADDLRRRHYTADVALPQRLLSSADLVPELNRLSRQMLPLNEFLAEALYGERVPVLQ